MFAGNIYTEASFDRETNSMHEILVMAIDDGGRTGFSKVWIHIKDRNDNRPVFALPEYQANIPVDTNPGNSILKVLECL